MLSPRRYSKAMGGETAQILGAGMEEMFRCVPELRSDGELQQGVLS
jgi:hypothetical protein